MADLMEGRKPNFHISSSIAESIGEKPSYIKHKGIDNEYYQNMILKFLDKFEVGVNLSCVFLHF
jgi:ATP-dependent DNA helicase RecG